VSHTDYSHNYQNTATISHTGDPVSHTKYSHNYQNTVLTSHTGDSVSHTDYSHNYQNTATTSHTGDSVSHTDYSHNNQNTATTSHTGDSVSHTDYSHNYQDKQPQPAMLGTLCLIQTTATITRTIGHNQLYWRLCVSYRLQPQLLGHTATTSHTGDSVSHTHYSHN
jgi:hypothetical protein